jgi:hypothetical protein
VRNTPTVPCAVIKVALLLTALAGPQVQPGAVLAADTSASATPRWSVVEAAERGTVLEALLFVPGLRGSTGGRRHVELQSTTSLLLWFRPRDAACDARGGSDLHRVDVPAGRDTILAVCGRSLRSQTVRIMATVVQDSSSTGTLVATSDPVTLKEWSVGSLLTEPPAWLATALFGLLGFFGARMAASGERRSALQEKLAEERRAQSAKIEEESRARNDKIAEEARAQELRTKQHAQEMERLAAEGLAPELAANRYKLREWLDTAVDRASAPDPVTLQEAGHSLLLDEKRGVLAYLGQAERRDYLSRALALYEAIGEYNRIAGDFGTISSDPTIPAAIKDDTWQDVRAAAERLHEAFTASDARLTVLRVELGRIRNGVEARIES